MSGTGAEERGRGLVSLRKERGREAGKVVFASYTRKALGNLILPN